MVKGLQSWDAARNAYQRLQLSAAVELFDEDNSYRAWSQSVYRVETRSGVWMSAPGTRFDVREIAFDQLVERVSRHARLGFFLHPKCIRHLDRHIFSMSCFLLRSGWLIRSNDNLCLVLGKGSREVTVSCENGKGLLLAVAIFALFRKGGH